LRDLINIGEIAAFMNNILVEIEEKEKYDKIVEEVLRRIEKNDLYVKPKKCMWKVREINFLGLVMGSEEIKIQKEKVVRVLEWPRPKTVKEVQKFL